MPLLFGAALGLPTAVLAGCNSLLRAQERSTAFVSVGLFATVGAQALAIAGVIVSPVPAAYLTGALIATSAAMLVGLVLTRSIGVKPATRATLRTALAYGLPTVPYMISIFALVFADRFVIAAIDGPGAVGQYQVALAFGFLGVALVQSLQTAWLPMTFAASPGERWGMLGEISATVTRLAAFAAGFLALAAQPALSVLVPGTYDTGRLANVAAIGALATVGWATYLARTQVLLWEKRTRPLAWITPAAAALDLGLVAVLLPPFGLEGAAAATVAAVLVQTVLVGRAARGVAVVPWHLRTEAFAYGLAAACVGLALLLPGTPWGTGIQIAAMTLAGLGFLRALAAELRLIRRPAPEEPGEPGAQQPPL
jgi:O-antigen/teichoic acid export membrane protein